MKNRKFFINDRDPGRVLVIAELGTSHGADQVKAMELIDAAAEAGADCIKFQIVYAGEILHPNTGEVMLPGGKIRLYDRFRELETDPSFFAEMKETVEKKGLVFLCTPFGLQSARELKALSPKCIKIASPELNFTALLGEIASYNIPTLLSTGVSKLGDIDEALSILRKKNTCAEVCLLHCVTAYPAPEKDYNLRILGNLRAIFGVPVGISDHSLDPCLVPALGTAMGACVIEKHFCLDQKDCGLDDPIALTPESFTEMVKMVRSAEKSDPEETIKTLSLTYGKSVVEDILGDGVKRLAPSELANYERTNRSIHALRDIAEGETIDMEMIASLRTEKILRPGLPPDWEERIIGRKAGRFIPAGEGIRFCDL
ncbi:MAG: N-acetylneuraminate synthase family protein [Treponema sp.]|nr:N-acetylneuraminate synthase family protein [Treponema sp.]